MDKHRHHLARLVFTTLSTIQGNDLMTFGEKRRFPAAFTPPRLSLLTFRPAHRYPLFVGITADDLIAAHCTPLFRLKSPYGCAFRLCLAAASQWYVTWLPAPSSLRRNYHGAVTALALPSCLSVHS